MKLASEVSEALPLNLESPVAPFSSSEKTCVPRHILFPALRVGLFCSFASATYGEPVVMGRRQNFGMKCCSILPTLHLCLALTFCETVTLSAF